MEFCPRANMSGTGASRPVNKRAAHRSDPERSARRRRGGERGAGNLKAILWTIILVAFIYATAMVLPVLINEYQFQDSIQTIARFASVNHRTSDQIQKSVLEEAEKEDLPVEADDIKVKSVAGNIQIDVSYSVTVDLKVYQWTLNFHPAASNASIL
jgi:cell division protein FtsL